MKWSNRALESNVFYLFAGNYTGQTLISRPNVTIYGETWTPFSYLGNRVTLSVNMPASQAGSNDLSGTVRVHATGVSFYNLDIENTYGLVSVSIQILCTLLILVYLASNSGPGNCFECASRRIWVLLLQSQGQHWRVVLNIYLSDVIGSTRYAVGQPGSTSVLQFAYCWLCRFCSSHYALTLLALISS